MGLGIKPARVVMKHLRTPCAWGEGRAEDGQVGSLLGLGLGLAKPGHLRVMTPGGRGLCLPLFRGLRGVREAPCAVHGRPGGFPGPRGTHPNKDGDIVVYHSVFV